MKQPIHHTLLTILRACTSMLGPSDPSKTGQNERGDVPGWVMITLMSAILVAGLLALAGPALSQLFNEAISQVSAG